MAKAIGANLTLEDIDRSHRLGKPKPRSVPQHAGQLSTRPRSIIVKFSTYRARNKLMKLKSHLKSSGYKDVYINEDLTKSRSQVFFQARKLQKDGHVKSTWTSDGVILIKANDDRITRFETLKDFNDCKQKEGLHS